MKVLADEKEEIIYTVPKYQHFIAAWIKFDTFYFQIFCKKRGNLLTRGKLSSITI